MAPIQKNTAIKMTTNTLQLYYRPPPVASNHRTPNHNTVWTPRTPSLVCQRVCEAEDRRAPLCPLSMYTPRRPLKDREEGWRPTPTQAIGEVLKVD